VILCTVGVRGQRRWTQYCFARWSIYLIGIKTFFRTFNIGPGHSLHSGAREVL